MTNELTTVEMADFDTIAKRYTLAADIARGMSAASLLPMHLRTRKVNGKIEHLEREEIAANCLLICNQALRWGVDPFALAPETYVVGGKLGFQGKLVGAIVNKLAGLKENLRFEFEGDGDELTCTVIGEFKKESQPRTASCVLAKVKTDNEMFDKDPEQKLIYTTTVKWARRHCPEVLLGIVTAEDPPETIDAFARDAVRPALPEVSTGPVGPDPELDEVTAKRESAADQPLSLAHQYEATIAGTRQRDTLTRLVDKIRAEPLDLLSEAEQERLVALARERYSECEETVSA